MRRSVLLAGLCAVLAALGLHVSGALDRLEQDTRIMRFDQRGAQAHDDVLLVAIDGEAGSYYGAWPFPRRLHADAIDELTRLGARTIAYDIQFTEPTTDRDDNALFDAVARAGDVVLATTEVDGDRHNVLGGEDNVRAARAQVGVANLSVGRDARVERVARKALGQGHLSMVAARRAGAELPMDAFEGRGQAWIDFAGPPGTVPTVSFRELLTGKVPRSLVEGRVVVVGVTAATEQDLHLTSASKNRLMAGAEVQASAISTALRDFPLRSAPGWIDLLALLALAALPVLAAARRGAPAAAVVGVVGTAAWCGIAVAAFGEGWVVAVAGPLAGALLGTGAAVVAAWTAERLERRRSEERGVLLEGLVRARTADLEATQLELVQRLAMAAEWRDEDTGAHIDRMSRMCERLALAAGWSPVDAEELRHASALHDIGKIAIPDRVLLKPGRLDEEEWEVMRSHAARGAEMLAGSSSPMMQLAEVVARTHHERWDGGGYPFGIAGEDIPLAGRIASICDVFDALRSTRPYKEAWTLQAAVEELIRCAGTQFDPDLVALFVPIAEELAARQQTAAAIPVASGA